jgi:hypothetical protein
VEDKKDGDPSPYNNKTNNNINNNFF